MGTFGQSIKEEHGVERVVVELRSVVWHVVVMAAIGSLLRVKAGLGMRI